MAEAVAPVMAFTLLAISLMANLYEIDMASYSLIGKESL